MAKQQKQESEPGLPIATVKVPMAPIGEEGYKARHIQVQLEGVEAVKMKSLFQGLDQEGARLANGRRVMSNADAIRWMLQNLS